MLMLQRGLTYSRIVAILKERRMLTSITAVREIIVGISRRPDLRAAIAELLGQSADQLWPEPTQDHAA